MPEQQQEEMILRPIERRSGLSAKAFKEEYLKKEKPVVFTDLTKDWAALNKWNAEFFKTNYGDLKVPVVTPNYSKPGKGYMSSDLNMSFKDFIEATETGNTDLRLFLYDIFVPAPELRKDFSFPTIMPRFIKRFPFMFFGGKGSEVTMHYDIDCANVFLSQFVGNKRVVLFPPSESRKIYHHPFTVKSLIDPKHPDYEKFPALKTVRGYETILKHGETLYMPPCYWHYMQYLDFSFGLALRSQSNMNTRFRGIFNLCTHYTIDKGFNIIAPKVWHDWKEHKAYQHASKFER